jgi:hypothetical protein
VRWAIDGFGNFKAAGEYGGIFLGLLQRGIEIIIGHIKKKIAVCLAYGYIPLAWRAARIKFIPKPGRDSYELVKSFKSISLTSFFLKTVERPVDSHIRTAPLKSFPLMESQYAYQEANPLRLLFTILFKILRGA